MVSSHSPLINIIKYVLFPLQVVVSLLSFPLVSYESNANGFLCSAYM